ncbi:hypothetical protein M501DRAFT_985970 [Patellaria atrata CBS 101060]|uniref:non-specific serine/threonine protein kinase n=1 Tax=Patellaria atrata CBS 101060 TaxID=1346257 RepID=A0A9P4S899_9PEZI|nr:hypothetical protein M501DRAFT_985970 [Patellaria atrata CBS 101060]
MASSFNPPSTSSHRSPAFRTPVAGVSDAPAGTFLPGTKVQVGNHRVVIEKYLSEGGFAHVYIVRVPSKSGDKTDVAVLKRVAVPDKDALANMRTEVETMKKLKGHRHIVTYIDSHASQLKGGGYEVFLLMEYCAGGGLIDFMNTRLQHRLTEPEILHIFADVAEGVACMHYLKPPLLHRDLKVENVLISTSGSSRVYKLCDFGSTAPPRPAATTAAEGRLIEDDVQRHTTMQYRSPEMIDVYRKQPIDEKSDIWALGVLLYKLCYYTTPFEEVGQMAILTATFKFPAYPAFTNRIKKLIGSMLRENPQLRPNIYQVIREACSMRNTPVPIKDIYSNRTQSEARRNEKLPSPDPQVASPPPIVSIQKSPSPPVTQEIPDIVPMRRGRPTAPAQQSASTKPSPSPARGTSNDPFAALDSTSAPIRIAAVDELSAKFPSLDEFSLLHDRGAKFQFEKTSPIDPKQEALNKKVTEVLADEAFAQPSLTKTTSATSAKSLLNNLPSTTVSRSASVKRTMPIEPRRDPVSQPQPSLIHQPTPQRTTMVSTGTMTSRTSSPKPLKRREESTNPQGHHFATTSATTHQRAHSQPRTVETSRTSAPSLLQRPKHLELQRSQSNLVTVTVPKSPASSRPSLEGRRPSALDIDDAIHRSKSANARPRPASVYLESNIDYLRDREASSASRSATEGISKPSKPIPSPSADHDLELEDKNISDNVEFLRAMESEDPIKKKDRRISGGSKHSKRTSLPSISLSGTKNILAGKFGDAFRRFEGNEARTPSPLYEPQPQHPLTPIAGSEATADSENAIDETEDLPPEVKRELERRRLSQEEKRVAEAAAEYRRRFVEQGDSGRGGKINTSGITRASTIQNRVKSLLDDSQASPVKRTAEGYGQYTNPVSPRDMEPLTKTRSNPPAIARKPVTPTARPDLAYPKPRQQPVPMVSTVAPISVPIPSASAPPIQRTGSRPSVPSKPKVLRTGLADQQPQIQSRSSTSSTRPKLGAGGQDAANGEDWEENFSKRYPSLSGLEMVEADLSGRGQVRDL